MKTIAQKSVTLAAALLMAGCAAKEIPAPPPPEVAEVETQDSPQHLERARAVKVTAVVTDIDVAQRLVTLKDSDGNEDTIEVGPEVRNLAQVRRGDEVIVTYYESVVFHLLKPGEGKPGSGVAQVGDRAKPGEKPAAVGAEAVTVTATVQKVDKKKPSITLKGPDGKVVTLPVRDASKLDPVKVGDLLEITYKRALAIAVETPSK
jgi:hypothetical protein